MSVIIYGKRLCGQVDRVPGLFYTSTLFCHLNYLPLVPVGSYVVLEGSENGAAFNGKQIPLRLKSVLAGYLRGWLAAASLILWLVAGGAAASFYIGSNSKGGVLAFLAVLAALAGILWFLFYTSSWWFLPVQVALLLGSAAAYQDVLSQVPDPVRIPGAPPGSPERRRHDASYIEDFLLVANALALLYTLTRLLTPVSYRQALELGTAAGFAPELIAERLGIDPSTLTDSA